MSALSARRQQFAGARAHPDQSAASETGSVCKASRAALKGQRPACLWMTGLSGAGKSTVANAVEQQLHELGYHTYILDGDKMRGGLCADLGFTEDDRIEQNRRVAETARMLVDAGLIVLVAVISPFEKERNKARKSFAPGEFFEIYVSTPLTTCEERDTKGLYRRARENKLANFTGISSPYEPPVAPDLTLNCGGEPIDTSVDHMMLALRRFGIIA